MSHTHTHHENKSKHHFNQNYKHTFNNTQKKKKNLRRSIERTQHKDETVLSQNRKIKTTLSPHFPLETCALHAKLRKLHDTYTHSTNIHIRNERQKEEKIDRIGHVGVGVGDSLDLLENAYICDFLQQPAARYKRYR